VHFIVYQSTIGHKRVLIEHVLVYSCRPIGKVLWYTLYLPFWCGYYKCNYTFNTTKSCNTTHC